MRMTMRHLRIPETRAAARQMRNRRNATCMSIVVMMISLRVMLKEEEKG